MQFTDEPVDADEARRQRARYEPFTEAVRDLIDATIRTQAGAADIAAAQRSIEAVTARLRATQIDGPYGVQFTTEGDGMSWGNPVIGVRNPMAPPLRVESDGARCWAEFDLGAAYEGPPNHVHGGVSALILDHLLGEAASAGGNTPVFTGTISIKYLRGTPLGALRAEAWVERVDGIKSYARGVISDITGITVEADGVFITPQWARDPR
ncbi:PaaI family thioesterase [[Mycobacterium] burgundiense]|uniref:Acyl-coenzyme A thioesterase THEM4 n=1 Tax=[Mycobacterium] burgundiense TaxID=3064286 RepID=A0ABM9LN08_9MYCO|nr:PaaI family thioesterase [Mycolicibacterium sp. MU0053]CAJ1501830.1 PaaI family thioesterase [Mycolicibacterium sp. MU0053]